MPEASNTPATDTSNVIYVLGAGYCGLTAAAELAMNGSKVHVVAKDLGFMPPITIVGTQSRRWPGISVCNQTFTADDLNDREIETINRLLALSNIEKTGVKVYPGLKVSRKEGVWWNKRTFEGERLAKNRRTNNSMKMICTPETVKPSVKEALHKVGYQSVDETPVICVETKTYFEYLLSVIKRYNGVVSLGHTLTKEVVETMKGKAIVNCLGLNSKDVGGAEGTHFDVSGEVVIYRDCPEPVPFYVIDDDTQCAVTQCPNGTLYISGGANPKITGGWDQDSTKKTVQDADSLCEALFGCKMDVGKFSESWVGSRPSVQEGGFNVNVSRRADGQLLGNFNGVAGAGVAASWANAAILHEALKKAVQN
mmetsp:Transcript_147998/g.258076  ORF Transcript_147998/g.258076 Transcript_147998/m.258076 type:complete len:367 (-) Transcript_147998:23-1123(-)